MIELRTYTHDELAVITGTRNNQGIKRKLERWGVCFDEPIGTGKRMTITVTGISDPFKVFCITELDCDPHIEFEKLRNFLYVFLNDEEFAAMPDEVKENRLRKIKMPVSRPTISRYEERLDMKNIINRNTTDFIYYFAFKDTQRIVERAEYLDAWHQYWAERDAGLSSFEAISNMRFAYGGVARKQPKPEINGIYLPLVEELNGYIQDSFERELAVHPTKTKSHN